MTTKQQLERALLSLRVIHTWTAYDAEYSPPTDRRSSMRDIANKAAEGLGRPDLIDKERK